MGEQYGFRKDRSTFDLIFILTRMMEKRWEFGKDTVMTFIDIEKAYDSVPRQLVWDTLRKKQAGRGEENQKMYLRKERNDEDADNDGGP
ncbi:MAG: reverse transcriptase domain-containing protein [Arsenophonus sp. NC-PG7-MAG3]